MSEFIEVPAGKRSLLRRTKIQGVGINDSDYMVSSKTSGGLVLCPYYRAWVNMIYRCYSDNFQARCSTYIGCSVTKEWLTFSLFRKWMEKQDWQGKQLDKDLITPGNKIYSPNTCLFVSGSINNLILGDRADCGSIPQGVYFDKARGKYHSHCNISGKRKSIGRFNSVLDAEYAYLSFKSDLIKKMAIEPEALSSPKLQAALLRHAEIFDTMRIKCENDIKKLNSAISQEVSK